jgi:hypothetical protein
MKMNPAEINQLPLPDPLSFTSKGRKDALALHELVICALLPHPTINNHNPVTHHHYLKLMHDHHCSCSAADVVVRVGLVAIPDVLCNGGVEEVGVFRYHRDVITKVVDFDMNVDFPEPGGRCTHCRRWRG